MKQYLNVLLFLFCGVSISAQQIKWSPVITDKDYDYVKIIGQNEEGFYVLKSNISFEDERDRVGFRGRHYSISFFTDEMALKWTHELESPIKDGRIVSVNMVNERVLVTFSFADKKQKVYRIFGQYVNRSGEYTDSSKAIAETIYDKIDGKEKPDVFISQNQNRIACAYKNLPANKEEQSYHVVITDASLAIIYKKDFTVPFSEKKFVSENLVLSNEGGFYLFGIHYTNDKKAKDPGESFYVIYHGDNPDGEVRSEEINLSSASAGGKKFIIGASPVYDNINHKIVVAGFYSAGSVYSINGTFYYALRTDTVQQAEVRTTTFDANFLMKFRGEIKRNNNNSELVNYSINRIILRRDGGAVIIAEGVSSTYSSYYDYFTRMYITHRYYLYSNIIALSVNPDGSILWSDVISKDQQSRDDGGYYSSYCSDIYANKMYFVYNKYIGDNPSILLSTINSSGEQKTDVLFNEDEKILSIPMGGKQIAEDELVMPALREGKLRFVKVSF